MDINKSDQELLRVGNQCALIQSLSGALDAMTRAAMYDSNLNADVRKVADDLERLCTAAVVAQSLPIKEPQ